MGGLPNNLTFVGDLTAEDQIDLPAANISFADLDSNGDGVLNNSDDNVRDDGTSIYLEFGNNDIELYNPDDSLPELTEDLFLFG